MSALIIYVGGNRLLLINALKIIFLLAFIIFIHECGHFFVAKWCGVKVKEFAIGFGPTIWKKQGKETKYALRLIPLGGFVSMLGEEERSPEEGSFSETKTFKKIFIILAGAIVNILFGLFLYFILVSSSGNYMSTTIESIQSGYAAEKVDIRPGDKILKIDGIKIRLKSDIDKALNNSEGKELTITIKRENEIKDVLVVPTEKEIKVPQIVNKYYIGVIFKVADNNFVNNIYYGFWDTMDFSVSIVDNLKLLFTGKMGTESLMGPVGISQIVSETQGFIEFIYMVALISLSLGVTNLIPFPPLDGGKVVIYIIEAIRKKPMKENIEVGINMAGFVLLIALSIYVTYKDILRIF